MRHIHRIASAFAVLVPVLLAIFMYTVPAAAAISLILNDVPVDMPAAPEIVSGRVLVPLTGIADELGLYVHWDEAGGRFSIVAKGNTYEGAVGQDVLKWRGGSISTGVAPQVLNKTLYLPLQVLVDLMELRLVWDSKNKALRLTGAVSAQPGFVTSRDSRDLPEDKPKDTAGTIVGGLASDGVFVPSGSQSVGQTGGTPGISGSDDQSTPGLAFVPALPTITRVSFARELGDMRLHIGADQPIDISACLLKDPARLVIDVPQAQLGVSDRLDVQDPIVRQIRLSQFQLDMVRIVLDLEQITGYWIERANDKEVFIHLNQLLGGVRFVRLKEARLLSLEASGPLHHELGFLTEPERVIVDFTGASMTSGPVQVELEDTLLKRLRMSQFQPHVVRLVLDVEEPVRPGDVYVKTGDTGVELVVAGRYGLGAPDHEQVVFDSTGRLTLPYSAPGNQEWSATPREGLMPKPAVDAAVSDSGSVGKELQQDGAITWPVQQAPGSIALDHDGQGESGQYPAGAVGKEIWPLLESGSDTPEKLAKWLKGKRIVVDPGHGGLEVGAAGREGVWEKDLNLQVATEVKRFLERLGAEVHMTRMTDTLVSLGSRSDLANNQRADAFVSIHFNASHSQQAFGSETLFRENHEYSPHLAASLQKYLVAVLRTENRGIKIRDDLYILRTSQVPTALVEVAFLDHPEEGLRFLQPEEHRKAALGIALGLAHYFEQRTAGGARLEQEEQELLEVGARSEQGGTQ